MLVISRDAPYLQAVTEVRERTTFVISNQLAVLREAAPRADAILVTVGEAGLLQAIFSVATRLRWVHSFAAGVEAFLFPDLVQSPVTLTNARGAYKRALAEFVMAAVLFFAKDLRRLVRNQEAGVWQPFDVDDVHGKVIGIIGYGETGRASAELAHAFGMRVLGLRRDSLLESVFGPESLHEMLPLCDFVLLATPGTPQTRGMIGQREIGLMKADAIVINVGRGSLVHEAALVEALQQKRIRGAALDVFEVEPLPPGHPFYAMENVLLSPHAADHTPGYLGLGMESFIRNLQRFQNGEPLANVVDKTAGY